MITKDIGVTTMHALENEFGQWSVDQYMGDVNPKYGGFYWRISYADSSMIFYDVIRIVDTSDIDHYEMSNPVLIEQLSVNVELDKPTINKCLSIFGQTVTDFRHMGKIGILTLLCDAFLSYGQYIDYGQYFTVRMITDYDYEYDDGYAAINHDPNMEVILHDTYHGDITEFVMGHVA